MKTYAESKGPGASSVEIEDRDGKIILQFPNAVRWVALDPATAVQIAEAIVKAAKRCGWARPIILLPTKH